MAETDSPNVAFFMLNALCQEGIQHIFLVPGAMIDPFLSEYEKAGITAIVAAQEGGAAYMADGYGRARQGFGVCMGIGGPGVTNMVTALSAAYADRTAVLAIAGTIPFTWEGQGTFQDSSPTGIDDHDVLRSMTVFSEEIPDVDHVDSFLKKALRAMGGFENRPAFLSVYLDLQKATLTTPYEPLHLQQPARILDSVSVQSVPEVLAAATRIVILAGNGSVRSRAQADIEHFASAYDIPVVTTLRAKGAIPEDHPLSCGVFGLGGSLWANRVVMGDATLGIPKAEVLLVLGATLNENNTHGWMPDFIPEKGIVRVDINPNNVLGREYAESLVVGDVQTFLRWLQTHGDRYHCALAASQGDRQQWLVNLRQTPYYDTEADRQSNQVPLNPARVIADLRRAAPRQSVLVVDSGAHTFFTGHHWTSYAPNEFLFLSNTGPMGYGIAMGIGAKLARPHQPCVCVVGDGSLLMHGMEIHTAVRYQIPLVIVVINNSALGNVYLRARNEGPAAIALSEIPTQNWADFARSLGAGATVVESPDQLMPAFDQAFAAQQPFLVDVRCDRDCNTPNTQEAF